MVPGPNAIKGSSVGTSQGGGANKWFCIFDAPALVEVFRVNDDRLLGGLAVPIVGAHLDGLELGVKEALLGRQHEPELPAKRAEADLPDLVELVRARRVGAPLDDVVREVSVADDVEVAQVAPDVLVALGGGKGQR